MLPGEMEGLRLLLAEREETIRDLRARLDASEAERRHESEEHRRVQERLTGLLTHRQAGSRAGGHAAGAGAMVAAGVSVK